MPAFAVIFAQLTPLWGAIALGAAGWAWAKHLVAVAHRADD